LGSKMNAIPLSLDARSYPRDTHQGRHQDGVLQMSLVMRGALAETVGGSTEFGGVLSIVVKDPGVVHADRFGPAGADILRLSAARHAFGDLLDDPRRSVSWMWAHEPRTAAPFLRLARRATSTTSPVAADDPDVVDLLACLTARPACAMDPPRWLVMTMDAMRAEWHPSFTVADVARRAGVHPVYLARCVRRWYGVGVADELRRIRLTAAARALAAGGETVSRIAHAHGFADEPHLSREFSRATGSTPGRFRRLVRTLRFRSARV
jgi:AraC family transcriptional regulator